MNSWRLATLGFASDLLANDLEAAESFVFNGAYSEFVLGEWRSCMLWNTSGDIAEGHLSSNDHAARLTAYGAAMPYLRAMIERTFRLDRLRFGRLARMMPNTVLVPHCDFLELDRGLVRIHVPLATSRACLNAEEDWVFHMAEGEIWHLDARRIHSAASTWDCARIHLILDFASCGGPEKTLRIDCTARATIPDDALVARPPLTPVEEASLMALGDVIDRFNHRDILAILIRKAFTRHMPLQSIFTWLAAMAERSGQADLIETIERQRRYYTVARG